MTIYVYMNKGGSRCSGFELRVSGPERLRRRSSFFRRRSALCACPRWARM